jgi:sugar/nucleoside kinase (ribokinase family)
MIAPLTVIGNVNLDLVMGNLAPWPQPGTEVILTMSEWRVGGAAGNSALAMRAMGLPFRLIASRGGDAFGAWLAAEFGSHAQDWTVTPQATGLSVGITHPDGERTFFTSLGHLASFGIDDVMTQLAAGVTPGGIALLAGVFVTPRLRPGYPTLIAALRDRGYVVAVDTGWPDGGWTPDLRAEVTAWLPGIRHLLLNEVEARALSAMYDAPVEQVSMALAAQLASGGTAVIKRGIQGAIACQSGTVTSHAAAPVRVIDTIGAGDVFNAAYLAGISQGDAAAGALRFAVATATRAISTRPRQYDIPAQAGQTPRLANAR